MQYILYSGFCIQFFYSLVMVLLQLIVFKGNIGIDMSVEES